MGKNSEEKYIRRIYLIPMLLIIAVFIIGSFFYSIFVRNAMLQTMRMNMEEIGESLGEKIKYSYIAKEKIEGLLEDRIRAAARIVFNNRQNLSNEFLEQLAKDLDVEEIHWFDSKGELIYSTVEGYLGWQTHPQHPLYAILQGQRELMEDIRPDERFGRLLKHGALRDTDGTFVQVAILAEKVVELTDKFTFASLVKDIGEKDKILYIALLDHNKEPLTFVDNGQLQGKLELTQKEGEGKGTLERQTFSFYELLLPVNIDDKFTGYFHIAYSKRDLNLFFIGNLVIINTLGFIFLLFAISFNGMLQQRYIIKPITALKKDVASISLEENISFRLPIEEGDPFYNLREIINYLLDKIQSYIERLNKKQEDLEFANRELEEILGELSASEEEIKSQYEELAYLWQKNLELKDKYEMAIKGTNSIIWEVDRDLNVNFTSAENLTDLFDNGKKTKVEDVVKRFVHSEDRETVLKEFNKIISGDSEEIDVEVRVLGGEKVSWYLVKGKGSYQGEQWHSINGVMIDITDLKEKELHIQYLADHDPLTGLFNRRKLIEILNTKLSKGEKGWIFLLDLDNFKNINDTLGHFYGDKLLQKIAEVLQENLTQGEIFRIGGDEFIILLDPAVDIASFSKEIFKVLKEKVIVDNLSHLITASIGIVGYPIDGTNIEDLLKKVDIAMYQSKNTGKNKYTVFDQRMADTFSQKVKIENQLRDALKKDGFTLHYQPVIDTERGKTAYVEALLRLKDNWISPALFIPIAEESDLIISIGKWVIEKVVKDIESWKTKGINTKVAINISPKQLSDPKFLPFIEKVLKESSISPKTLEFEITENILLENREENIELLNKIRELGVSISLDDFGTGYSSLNYLTYVPLDKIKLDKSIKDRFIQLDKITIIDSIVNIAHGLELKVVAEGIETEEEYKRFKKANCDYLQGYYFSKPVDKDTLENFFL
ncbi:EAL domain-containing protein [Anaerobranca californiensis]|nr:EAL domain-containing protein [Anaerobranca californiensis]